MLAPKAVSLATWHPHGLLREGMIRQWYVGDGNAGSGNWSDVSGGGHTLALEAGDLEDGARKSKPTYRLTGGGYMRSGAVTSNEPCEIWTACMCIGTGVIFSGRTAQSTVLRRSNGTTGLYIYNSAGGEAAITVASGLSLTNRWVVLRARFNGATSEVWENGVFCGTANLSGILDPSGLTIGAHTDGWGVADCEFGEVLVTELLTATSAYRLAAYLMRKWV